MGSFGFLAALATLFLIIVKTAKWPALTRGLLAFGTSASVLGFFHWIQFLATPWPQESGRVVESQPLWPIVIVIGIPALVCYFLYRAGADDAKHIKLCGYEPGVLPDGVSLKTWDDSKNWSPNIQLKFYQIRRCSQIQWFWQWSLANYAMDLQPW